MMDSDIKLAMNGLRLGVRAHDFGGAPAEELAARIAAAGFSCVQLALNKAIAGLHLKAGELTTELACNIGHAFARQGVAIEVLGCYINPIHPDLQTRHALLDYFKDHLRFARGFGCELVALESGSVDPDYLPHPANQGNEAFDAMLKSLSELVAVAESFDVRVGLEAVTSHTVSSAQHMRRVLDIIGSKHLKVVFDPVNLLSIDNADEQARVVPQALELLSQDIAVFHAKDFVVQNGTFKTVPAGCGRLDYGPVLQFLRSRKSGPAIILEETSAESSAPSAEFIRRSFLGD
jgi:L-ribulose-5-phosphate 3-epimerase